MLYSCRHASATLLQDTLLKEHQEAALARREQKDAGATLEERVALNAAQKAEVAELRKQEVGA